MLSPFKKALLCWRTSDMNGEAIVSVEADGRGCVLIKGISRSYYEELSGISYM